MPVRTTKARFKPELLKQAETLGGMGMTLEEIAYALDINPQAWTRYTAHRPEFAQAIERGQGKANAKVKQAIYKKAADGDSTAQSLWMRNQPAPTSKTLSVGKSKYARPLKLIRAASVFTPDAYAIPPSVKNSPHADHYIQAARSGWTARHLSQFAERQFGEHISDDIFEHLLRAIPLEHRVPPHYLETVLKGVDATIDCVAELQNLIALQKVRVTDILHSDAGIDQVRAELDMLQRFIKDYTTMAVNLGLMQKPTNGHGGVVDAEITVEARIRDNARALTPEQRAKLLSTINEIRGTAELLCQRTEHVLVQEHARLQIGEPEQAATAEDALTVTDTASASVTPLEASAADEAACADAADALLPTLAALGADALSAEDEATGQPDTLNAAGQDGTLIAEVTRLSRTGGI